MGSGFRLSVLVAQLDDHLLAALVRVGLVGDDVAQMGLEPLVGVGPGGDLLPVRCAGDLALVGEDELVLVGEDETWGACRDGGSLGCGLGERLVLGNAGQEAAERDRGAFGAGVGVSLGQGQLAVGDEVVAFGAGHDGAQAGAVAQDTAGSAGVGGFEGEGVQVLTEGVNAAELFGVRLPLASLCHFGAQGVALPFSADTRTGVALCGVRVEPLVQCLGAGFEFGGRHALRRTGDQRWLGSGLLHQNGGCRAGPRCTLGAVQEGHQLGGVPPGEHVFKTVILAALVAQCVRSDLDGLGPIAALAQQDLDVRAVRPRLELGNRPPACAHGVGEFGPPQPGEEGGGYLA